MNMSTVELPPPEVIDDIIESDALYEVVDGQIVEKPPMGSLQEFTASRLQALLGYFVYQNKLGHALVETLFDFGPKLKNKRRPDLAFLSAKRWPLDRPISEGNGAPVVPDIAIEVISPSNRWDDVLDKLAEYFRVGVERVWVISPRHRQIQIFDDVNTIRILGETDVLTDDLIPGFELNLSELFSIPAELEPGPESDE